MKEPPSFLAKLIQTRFREEIRVFVDRLFRLEKFFVVEKNLDGTLAKVVQPKIHADFILVQNDGNTEKPQFVIEFSEKFDGDELFEDGDVCGVAKINGEVVHWLFATFEHAYIVEREKKINLSPGSALLYATYTVEQYRRLGIANKMLNEVLNYLCERGIRKVYGLIRCENIPSLNYVRKAGFRTVGVAMFAKIYKVKLIDVFKFGCKHRLFFSVLNFLFSFFSW